MISNKIGNNIKKIRELRNFTQEFMAECLGISRQSYIKVENCGKDLSIIKLEKIAEVLNIKLSELLDFEISNVFIAEKQINNAPQSVNYHRSNFNSKLQEVYEERISELKEEVTYLRDLLKSMVCNKDVPNSSS